VKLRFFSTAMLLIVSIHDNKQPGCDCICPVFTNRLIHPFMAAQMLAKMTPQRKK
jgi:hypothetical protein